MSAPSHTYFCDKGHVVADLGEGEMLVEEIHMEEPGLTCPHCGSKAVKMICDWRNGNTRVPSMPIEITEKQIIALVCRYDVSTLFKEKE